MTEHIRKKCPGPAYKYFNIGRQCKPYVYFFMKSLRKVICIARSEEINNFYKVENNKNDCVYNNEPGQRIVVFTQSYPVLPVLFTCGHTLFFSIQN